MGPRFAKESPESLRLMELLLNSKLRRCSVVILHHIRWSVVNLLIQERRKKGLQDTKGSFLTLEVNRLAMPEEQCVRRVHNVAVIVVQHLICGMLNVQLLKRYDVIFFEGECVLNRRISLLLGQLLSNLLVILEADSE